MDKGEFRQWAAICAMQGILSNPKYTENDVVKIAKAAVEMADAMVEAFMVVEPSAKVVR